jgi:hypothetical protein
MTAPELSSVIQALLDTMGPLAFADVKFNYALASGANKVRHGMKQKAPRGFVPVAYTAGVVLTRTQAADRDFIYITASAATSADIYIVP